MRALFFTFIVPVVAFAAEPKVSAPIPSEDIRDICKVVASVTGDPVSSVRGELVKEPVPGSVPHDLFHIARDGTKVTDKYYERCDLVWATTLPKTGLPMMYQLEKSPHGWKILRTRTKLIE